MEMPQKLRVDGKNMLFHNENRGSYHSSKSTTEKKHHKIQGALRGCGNWSEHISSSGKKYFYNNLSEVSQWEKPKDWNESDVIDLKSKDKNKFSSSHKNSASKSHHSSHRSSNHQSSEKSQQSYTNETTDKDYRSNNHDRDYRSNKASSNDRDYRDIDYRDKLTDINKGKDKDYRTSSNSKTFNHVNVANNANLTNVRWDGKKTDVTNGKHSSTEYLSQSNRSKGVLHENSEDTSDKPNSESTASLLVRTLSNVLNQAATTNTSNNSAEGNLKNALQLLIKAAAKNQEAKNEEDDDSPPPAKKSCPVPEETEPEKKTERSPEPELVVPDFVHLDYLRPVFEPAYVGHIQNWPSDICEKQCHQFSTDYHKFLSEHITSLNAELTSTRSKVRASEIISTVKEQRVLNIRQQIKDLDKMSSTASSLT